MKLIRYILSNLILIMFFCGIIYAYYYWDNLTGEDTPAGQAVAYLSKEFKSVEAFINGIKVKQNDTRGNDSVPEATTTVVTETKAATEGTVASLVEADVAVTEESDQTQIESINNEDTISVIKEGVFVTPEIEQTLNQAVSDSVTNTSGLSAIVTDSNVAEDPNRTLWVDARKAFYKRNYEASIASYNQLIASSVDNYDAYGELGNVYFNQGKKVEAAAAYYEAASLLVKSGQQGRADSLLPLLGYLDTKKATQLKQLLDAGRS